MQIRCPECQFTRHVDESKIPASAALATCPKCRHKFRFRDFSQQDEFVLEPDTETAGRHQDRPPLHDSGQAIPRPVHTAAPAASGDIWDDIASLGDKKPQSGHTGGNDEAAGEITGAPDQDAASAADGQNAPPTADGSAAAQVDNAFAAVRNTPDASGHGTQGHTTEADAGSPAEAAPQRKQFDDVIERHANARRDPLGTVKAEEHAGDDDDTSRAQPDDFWQNTPAADNPDQTRYSDDPVTRRVEAEEETYAIPDDLHDRLNRPEPQDIPWEWPDRFGFVGAFMETAKRVIFSPARFFGTMRPGLTITAPITFYLLTGMFEELATRGWVLATARMYREAIAASPLADFFNQMVQSTGSISILLMSVVFLVLKLIMLSGLYQVFLRLVGGDKGGFVTTFRVVAYANAVGLLALFPFFGQIVGPLWYFALTLAGIKHGHRISWGKAIFAALPVYLLLLIFIVMVLRNMLSALV
jgi:predicted Zn finger-like uncharacterized protein